MRSWRSLAKPEAGLPAGAAAAVVGGGSWTTLMAGVFAGPPRLSGRPPAVAALALVRDVRSRSGFALVWTILSTSPGPSRPAVRSFREPARGDEQRELLRRRRPRSSRSVSSAWRWPRSHRPREVPPLPRRGAAAVQVVRRGSGAAARHAAGPVLLRVLGPRRTRPFGVAPHRLYRSPSASPSSATGSTRST